MFPNSLNISRLILRNNPILKLEQYWISTIWNQSKFQNYMIQISNENPPNQIILLQNRYFSSLKATSDVTKKEIVEPNSSKDDILYKSIQLEARSADRGVLDSYEKFVLMTAKFLDIPVSRVWEPFRHIKRRTLLRSAFVKKKYRVQYEFRTFFRSIELKHLTGSTADTFLEYIERNLPEGTALQVTRQKIEKLPGHLKPPSQGQN